MARDPALEAHQEWLGYLQPVGLVVSPPALMAAQALIDRNVFALQDELLALVQEVDPGGGGQAVCVLSDFPTFTRRVLGWEAGDLLGAPGAVPVPDELEVVLPNENDRLRPTYAVREVERDPAATARWVLLVEALPMGMNLDREPTTDTKGWAASPQARFERLLRETRVPLGLLVNGTHLRLVYAPPGETSGHVTFPVQAMTEVAGRPILSALHMLLSAERLLTLPLDQRLPHILAESRRYQGLVSTRLAGQVLSALYELLRGFQAADDQRQGEILRDVLRNAPDEVYGGLLTVLLRLVFLLYAEDRGLTPAEGVYANHYSVTGLYERLRADAGRHPDTMDQRYGAWAQLLTTFRLVYDGGRHGLLSLPARKGYLFNPDRYPFLEGRAHLSKRQEGERLLPPLVPDGVIHRVLGKLLLLDGERLSYRSLDVEQIGSVYEASMGFRLERAAGRSIAIRPKKAHGAPETINLDALLTEAPANRGKWLKERTDQTLTAAGAAALKQAKTVEEVVAALGSKVAREVTPNVVPRGAMVLQPSDERRRSGSHSTPRDLTEPIVRKALAPVLKGLGERPTPEQVLGLKVCDPAMGSGAFLVEVCRQLGDALERAWREHGQVPEVPPDEDAALHARRLVAQRCLYGVDKNALATDLAKLSLWLVTLAKDHPFTFVDHALKVGDSLVGLTREQIVGFNWEPRARLPFLRDHVTRHMGEVRSLRNQLAGIDDEHDALKRGLHEQAEKVLEEVRRVGDLVVAAFFAADNARGRGIALEDQARQVEGWFNQEVAEEELDTARRKLREGVRPVIPFHWEIEFPEVFERERPGYDAIVGNPPFPGKNTVAAAHREGYLDWLKSLHEESHGASDLVAHFFRRSFTLLRPGGTFGLIATNTIAQGDTRSTGLRWLCTHGGTIYSARKRYKWPGQAAVVVSVVHVCKGPIAGPFDLDGDEVPLITAFLFHAGGHDDPHRLGANANQSFQGSVLLGMGFTFDDTSSDGVTSPLAEMQRLIAKDARNAERICPYIGGEEVNDSPTHANHRCAINFGQMTEDESRRWPDLMAIVEQKVRPERMKQNRDVRKRYWWRYGEVAAALYDAIRPHPRVLVNSQVGARLAFAFLPATWVYGHTLNVYALSSYAAFGALQCRAHEVWARFFGSSMKDDLRYTPTDCFETFPFPPNFDTDPNLEETGKAYYEFRADLMVRNNEGLTKTYNRFHDPNERSADIARLRELHAAMDQAVLAAYGWADPKPPCAFLLDYEDDEEDEPTGGRQRRKPWRYRWSDEVRDEVLARLLDLNHQRAEQEQMNGGAGGKRRRK